MGRKPCAFIEKKRGHETVSEDDIIAFARENMAKFKAPRHVVFVELPKTSTGKIQKFRLREMAKDSRVERPRAPSGAGRSAGISGRSMNGCCEAFQFVFYSKFLLFEGRDPGFIPIGVGHFSGDDFFQFFVLISQMLDLSF